MARVECEIEEVVLENDEGYEQEGVEATCSRCGHQTQSFGVGPASRRRCLVLMREECPESEKNYYIDADA